MPFTNDAKNRMLDVLDEGVDPSTGAARASLHSAYPGATGANELAGGSPAYARKAIAWGAAANGQKTLAAAVTFDVPAGDVKWVGFWSSEAVPKFLGSAPAGASGAIRPFTVNDTTLDQLESAAHGLVVGDKVAILALGQTLPTGLTDGTIYKVATVVDANKITLQTEAGGALDITAAGNGYLQKCVPETFAAQGTYQLSSATLELP